jgi:hypothetical protein
LNGTVSSVLGVSKLEYRLNDERWRQITVSNNSTLGFSTQLDERRGLKIGSNQIQLRVQDTAQRTSPILVRQFTYRPQALLTLQIEGAGSVTRGFLGQTQRWLGQTYTLTATPRRDFLFLGWKNQWGDFLNTQPRFDFLFEFEQTLTAVFIPTPFAASAGAYLGFLSSQEPLPEGRGDLNLQLTRIGSLSGKLRLGNLSFSFRGAFDSAGNFQQILGAGKVDLRLQIPPDAPAISATLTVQLEDFSLESTGTLSRPLPGNPAGQRKNWSLSISGSDIPNTPTQTATAALTFGSNYRARIVGRLADGTAWSISSQLLEDFNLPAFTPLYRNKGQFSGSFALPEDQTSASGTFLWHRPPQPNTNFPAGFLLLPEVSATIP